MRPAVKKTKTERISATGLVYVLCVVSFSLIAGVGIGTSEPLQILAGVFGDIIAISALVIGRTNSVTTLTEYKVNVPLEVMRRVHDKQNQKINLN